MMGTLRKEGSMVKENLFFQPEMSILVNSRMGTRQEREQSAFKVVLNLKETGQRIKRTDSEF